MDDDFDLRDFSNITQLFPLPNIVLFPNAVLPLHIFEDRYREMTADALASDKLVTIANLRPFAGKGSIGNPPLEQVACLGQILQHEQLEDGRFNFLLLGRKRVRLTQELETDKLYRIARAEILEDELDDGQPTDGLRDELVEHFRAVFQSQQRLDDDLNHLLGTPVPLGVLSDIIGHALGLPSEWKQRLLNEPRVMERSGDLLNILKQIVAQDPELARSMRPFPPPFSVN